MCAQVREIADHVTEKRAALLRALGIGGRPPVESAALYDLDADPSEAHDLSGDRPEVLAAMVRAVGTLAARMPPAQPWWVLDAAAGLRVAAAPDGRNVSMHAPWAGPGNVPRLFSMMTFMSRLATALVACEVVATAGAVVWLTRRASRACHGRAAAMRRHQAAV